MVRRGEQQHEMEGEGEGVLLPSKLSTNELEQFLFGSQQKRKKQPSEKSQTMKKKKSEKNVDAPAWEDPDDDVVRIDASGIEKSKKKKENIKGKEYTSHLRKKYEQVRGSADWAKKMTDKKDKSRKDDEDVTDFGFERSGGLTVGSRFLQRGIIAIERMTDANKQDVSNAAIKALQFHPTAQLLLTASLDRKLRLFNIDGKTNEKIQGVKFDDISISSAAFTPDGQEVIVSGERSYFYVYNIQRGRIDKVVPLSYTRNHLKSILVSPNNETMAAPVNNGCVLLLSRSTKQRIGELKVHENKVQATCYNHDGRLLYTATSGGIICEWDVGTRKCIRRLSDLSSFNFTSLASSANSRWLVSGSKDGIVNVYDLHASTAATSHEDVLGAATPLTIHKTIMNLTTSVDNITFNHADGQVLAFASSHKARALRLAHIPSFTIFSNWPTLKQPLQLVTSMDFSPKGGLLAVGNAKGRVLLFRLKHFGEI